MDLKKYEEFSEKIGENIFSGDHSSTFLIKGMLQNMTEHVSKQLKTSFLAVVKSDKEKANLAMEMDYTTNNMFEKTRSSVETVVSIDPATQFSKTLIFNEITYDLERIGDYCDHFSKFTINEDNNQINKDILDLLKSMYKSVNKMIQNAMDAFLNGKLSLKGDIMDLEEKVHNLQKKTLNFIAIEIAETSFEDKDEFTYYIYIFQDW
ncbi:hypothetical protein ALNOE001_09170 [Candidatus Methanobinarius endosymbioticus]|uniref:PhoU domain-containing protein n=1 Tax=Candidatus Methanobinarius endosymbioticus TaxID=2006182 RepID=A0A366MAX7_9EURY|nr:hypothetical protein ALNOE001_09170 [Candidatus Methanobinarius endosymbioticus]